MSVLEMYKQLPRGTMFSVLFWIGIILIWNASKMDASQQKPQNNTPITSWMFNTSLDFNRIRNDPTINPTLIVTRKMAKRGLKDDKQKKPKLEAPKSNAQTPSSSRSSNAAPSTSQQNASPPLRHKPNPGTSSAQSNPASHVSGSQTNPVPQPSGSQSNPAPQPPGPHSAIQQNTAQNPTAQQPSSTSLRQQMIARPPTPPAAPPPNNLPQDFENRLRGMRDMTFACCDDKRLCAVELLRLVPVMIDQQVQAQVRPPTPEENNPLTRTGTILGSTEIYQTLFPKVCPDKWLKQGPKRLDSIDNAIRNVRNYFGRDENSRSRWTQEIFDLLNAYGHLIVSRERFAVFRELVRQHNEPQRNLLPGNNLQAATGSSRPPTAGTTNQNSPSVTDARNLPVSSSSQTQGLSSNMQRISSSMSSPSTSGVSQPVVQSMSGGQVPNEVSQFTQIKSSPVAETVNENQNLHSDNFPLLKRPNPNAPSVTSTSGSSVSSISQTQGLRTNLNFQNRAPEPPTAPATPNIQPVVSSEIVQMQTVDGLRFTQRKNPPTAQNENQKLPFDNFPPLQRPKPNIPTGSRDSSLVSSSQNQGLRSNSNFQNKPPAPPASYAVSNIQPFGQKGPVAAWRLTQMKQPTSDESAHENQNLPSAGFPLLRRPSQNVVTGARAPSVVSSPQNQGLKSSLNPQQQLTSTLMSSSSTSGASQQVVQSMSGGHVSNVPSQFTQIKSSPTAETVNENQNLPSDNFPLLLRPRQNAPSAAAARDSAVASTSQNQGLRPNLNFQNQPAAPPAVPQPNVQRTRVQMMTLDEWRLTQMKSPSVAETVNENQNPPSDNFPLLQRRNQNIPSVAGQKDSAVASTSQNQGLQSSVNPQKQLTPTSMSSSNSVAQSESGQQVSNVASQLTQGKNPPGAESANADQAPPTLNFPLLQRPKQNVPSLTPEKANVPASTQQQSQSSVKSAPTKLTLELPNQAKILYGVTFECSADKNGQVVVFLASILNQIATEERNPYDEIFKILETYKFYKDFRTQICVRQNQIGHTAEAVIEEDKQWKEVEAARQIYMKNQMEFHRIIFQILKNFAHLLRVPPKNIATFKGLVEKFDGLKRDVPAYSAELDIRDIPDFKFTDRIIGEVKSSVRPVGDCSKNAARAVECSTGCKGGKQEDECRNNLVRELRKTPVSQAQNLLVRKTENRGLGLFAKTAIPKLTLLGEYTGVREHESTSTDEVYTADYDKSKGIIVSALNYGSLMRFANTACNPNSELTIWTVDGKLTVFMITMKDLAQNEEITINYCNMLKFCKCGYIKCEKPYDHCPIQ